MVGVEDGTGPVFNYEGCTQCYECVNVCPAQALSTDESGNPVVNIELCLGCGACENVCPGAAITMGGEGAKAYPIISENACIGCGACEVHCPVGTVASMKADQPAIHVEGVSPQRFI